MAYQHVESMPQPDPRGADSNGPDPPAWPWWYAPVGFGAAFGAVLVLSVFVLAAGMLAGVEPGKPTPALTIVGVFIQDVVLVATAVAFASLTMRPRPWHFGLRRAPLWRAVGYAAAGVAGFLLFGIAYSAAVHPEGDQAIAEHLGVNRGTLALIVGGVLVIVLAPVAEELFFRGFFYRALRNGLVRFGRVRGVLLAAAIDGLVFGIIHFEGPDSLSFLPLLAVLGFVFCLVYEYTGTLFATIALHAMNNAVAYSVVAKKGAPVAVPLALAMIGACVLLPRLLGGARGATAATREAASAP